MQLKSSLLRGPGRSRRPLDVAATSALVAGGLLLAWSAYIHFHLWSDGYKSIPTIGPLFLFQSITALAIGVAIVAVRRLWAALIGIGFILSTIGGFLISVEHGLFGFKDSWSAPFASEALTVEIVAVAMLVLAATLCLVRPAPLGGRPGSTPAGMTA